MPHSFINFRRVMRIPNICLVLKLDNGKVVYIADEQTDRRTKPPSTVLVYRYIVHKIYTLLDLAPPKQNFWVRQWLVVHLLSTADRNKVFVLRQGRLSFEYFSSKFSEHQ